MKQELYKGCLIKNKLTSNFGVVIDFGLYPTTDYTFIDQGYGQINIEKAYELLKYYIENNVIDNFETYSISSFSPSRPVYSTPNLFNA